MKKAYFILLTAIFLLTACGTNSPKPEMTMDTSASPVPLKVIIQLKPSSIQPDQPVTIQAIVTQGNQKVDDPQDVQFEIWKDGQPNHEMVKKIDHQTGGIYSIQKTFHEPGTYFVISHVTARDMHTMPKKQFVVGK
jgi:hypothetical protein